MKFDQLSVKRLAVLSDSGKECAVIEAHPNGGITLLLEDENGAHLRISVQNGIPSINLADSQSPSPRLTIVAPGFAQDEPFGPIRRAGAKIAFNASNGVPIAELHNTNSEDGFAISQYPFQEVLPSEDEPDEDCPQEPL